MAEHLNGCGKSLVVGSAFFWLVSVVISARAQDFLDPIRPPASLEGLPATTITATVTGPVLQSVLISRKRVEAIISGQAVKVGDRFGDAKVEKITASEVVLRDQTGLRTLKMFPGIEKRPAVARAGTKVGGQHNHMGEN